MDKSVFIIIPAALIISGAGWYFINQSSPQNQTPSEVASEQVTPTEPAATPDTSTTNPSPTAAPTTNTAAPITTNAKIMNATLHTNMGDITIEFFGADAPNTVANFIKLANAGFYDGTKFHRVIKGFMIQGGDPLSKDDSKSAQWGTGGPGYQFGDEIRANNHNDIGTISMANSGPNTNGSQFFINTAANNFLDSKHTTFGRVTAGMEVVSKIEGTQTAPGDRPLAPMIINSVTLN